MGKTFALGDVHGRYSQMMKLFELAKVDYENDRIISVGDLVDRGPEPFQVIFELMKIKNLIACRGNHDQYLLQWIHEQGAREHFLRGNHGSGITLYKWKFLTPDERRTIYSFLKDTQVNYFVDEKNRLFVHAGIDSDYDIEDQLLTTLLESRCFFETELMKMQSWGLKKIPTKNEFEEIYIGHTPTTLYRLVEGKYTDARGTSGIVRKPLVISNVWNIDTGAGFPDGRLSMVDVDTKETYQIEIV
jgi:serine/threonine protein phosphatase 1